MFFFSEDAVLFGYLDGRLDTDPLNSFTTMWILFREAEFSRTVLISY